MGGGERVVDKCAGYQPENFRNKTEKMREGDKVKERRKSDKNLIKFNTKQEDAVQIRIQRKCSLHLLISSKTDGQSFLTPLYKGCIQLVNPNGSQKRE